MEDTHSLGSEIGVMTSRSEKFLFLLVLHGDWNASCWSDDRGRFGIMDYVTGSLPTSSLKKVSIFGENSVCKFILTECVQLVDFLVKCKKSHA